MAIARKRVSLTDLAREAQVPRSRVIDELLHLDEDRYLAAKESIPHYLAERIKKRLGVATPKQLRTIKYWADVFGESESEMRQRLSKMGFKLSATAQNLPCGAYRALVAQAKKEGINPATGAIDRKLADGQSAVPKSQPLAGRSTKSKKSTLPPPAFDNIGRKSNRGIVYLKCKEVENIHRLLVKVYQGTDDPIDPPGVRDRNMLESALHRPRTEFDGTVKYPTIETSAAALLYALIHNHPFHNGNKRSSLVAVLAFLDRNSLRPTCDLKRSGSLFCLWWRSMSFWRKRKKTAIQPTERLER